ncbi:MAG: helix-turn-helix transcriptional regulator [Clostridia bacterium]|nr:helix-turn-helix transcriptional regulator [Clostridia bacterium]
MNTYQRLKDLREDAEKSQEEIAKIIGTTQSYYAQYENGKRSIPFERMVVLAEYYNVSLDYLAGFIDTPRKLKHIGNM